MNAEDVARYLTANPDFFEQYADLLAQVYVPHPRGGSTIALADRQVLTLRDKNKALETKLSELIQFGEENDAISEKMHRVSCALLAAHGLDSFLSALHYNLSEDLAVPHVAIRTWGGRAGGLIGDRVEFSEVGQETKTFAASLTHPFCGPSGNPEVAGWFGEAQPHIRSVALVALSASGGACVGLLALGSEDVMRFYPEMGTLYLRRLGELVSAGLSHLLS